MSTCKDCLHKEVCKDYAIYDKDSIISCDDFKPKADYVEVVRCNGCKFFHIDKEDAKYPFFCVHHSGPVATAPNHFCSYGIRKGGIDNGR